MYIGKFISCSKLMQRVLFAVDCSFVQSGGEKLDVCAKLPRLSCHDDWQQLNDTKPGRCYFTSFASLLQCCVSPMKSDAEH